MPSNPKPARAQLRPGADFDQRVIPVTRQPQCGWFRVHKSGSPAVWFGKFPHHRFSHPNCPFPLLYVGATIQTCLWEFFGDEIFEGRHVISETRWRGCCVSQISVPDLKVCTVTLARTREAMGVDRASLLAADLAIPQAWGLAVQEHPAAFRAIKYSSRFMDQLCLGLFDRDRPALHIKAKPLGALNDLDAAVNWLHERKVALV